MLSLIRNLIPALRRPEDSTASGLESGKIEENAPGYPRFTALLSAHYSWLVCRRFDQLRARLLLLKQDKLSELERKLQQIDHEEESPLFLGKSRIDGNVDRLEILAQIEDALADYDQFIDRTSRMLSMQPAEHRDVTSLLNWLDATGSLAREETEYLTHDDELVSLVSVPDRAALQLETWVERRMIQYWCAFRRSRFNNVSSDPNVYIYRGPFIQRMAKVMLLCLITLLLMMPVIVCNLVESIASRIIIVMVSTIFYLIVLTWLTRTRTMELIIAGATYATVLIVFVSGTTTLQT